MVFYHEEVCDDSSVVGGDGNDYDADDIGDDRDYVGYCGCGDSGGRPLTGITFLRIRRRWEADEDKENDNDVGVNVNESDHILSQPSGYALLIQRRAQCQRWEVNTHHYVGETTLPFW